MKYPLIVTNLKKSYKGKEGYIEALRGISFKVKKGEIFGLLGPNGAGKTTTINILTGILTADSGTIKIFGRDPCEEIQNRINTSTAYNRLNDILTVYQNLRVYAKIYNVRNPKDIIINLLKKFDIYELKDRKAFDLSSGQKTRLNLCKGLINSPDLLFLDEATSGLDPHIASKVREEVKKLDITIIFTSHIMSEVEQLCNRIAFLNKGKILKIDTPKRIKKLIRHNVFIIEFLSQPKNASKILSSLNITAVTKNRISIELETQKDIQNIVHKLITSEFEIRDLHVKRPTLDEIFIKIAEGKL